MSVAIEVSVGRSGTAGDHARYITRERATQGEGERVWTQNVPEHADHREEQGITYRERVADLREFARQTEEDELARPHRGNGQSRTHYRVIYSFDREVSDEKARRMVNEHLRENFPKARAIAAIHRDTDNPHVHVQIAARDVEGKKLQFNRREFQSIDEKWARIYGREFGQEHADKHLEKKAEWRAWMREAYIAKQEGREIPPRPLRVAHQRNQTHERMQMAGKQYGTEKGLERDADERTVGGNQRRVVGGERQTLPDDRADAGNVRRTERLDRAPEFDAGSTRHPAAARGETYARADRAESGVRDDAAIRARGRENGPGDRDDGALARAGRGQDHAGRRATGGLEKDLGLDGRGAERDAINVQRGERHERELLGHAGGALGAHPPDGGDRHDDRGGDLGLHLLGGDGSRHPDKRSEPELADLHLRHDGRAEGAAYGRNPGETSAHRGGTGFEPAGGGHAADDERGRADRHNHQRGGGGAAAERSETAAEQGAPATAVRQLPSTVTGDQLMQMMAEATRAVDQREAREEAERRAAEAARLAKEAAERAKELAERQAREQLLAKIRCEGALKEANRAADLKLHELMKERGPEALREAQTVERLGRTMEQTLTKEKTRLSELGLTKESLREQIKSYVEGVARDPEGFTRRMEPERPQQTKERSRGVEYDRGYGFSR